MTKDEAVEKLKKLRPCKEDEHYISAQKRSELKGRIHLAADDVVLEFLNANGYEEIVDAWSDLDALCRFSYGP